MEMEEGKYYHVYNRGNNSEAIFFEQENYLYFLRLIHKYISPVANIYSYCLLKNHFHILISTKFAEDIIEAELTYSTVKKPKKVTPSLQFSHLFNAYTQAINKRYKRTGSIFQKHYKFKEVDTEDYFLESIRYIHNNPIKHKICKNAEEYFWSSYNNIIENADNNPNYTKVLKTFGGLENFISTHQKRDF